VKSWKAGALGLAALSVACAGGRHSVRERGGRQASAYYPLEVGNRWTYEVGLLGEKSTQEVRIVGREGQAFVDNKGGRLTADAFGIRDDKRYLLREPLEAGATWTNVVSASSIERYRVLDAGVSCESPAGRFTDCVRVEGRNRVNAETTLINEMTFAPGVGLVDIETVAEVKGKRIPQASLRLASFEIKSPASPASDRSNRPPQPM
jgi:hypothetical protein